MDTRTGRIYTSEEVEQIERLFGVNLNPNSYKKAEQQFKEVFNKIPESERSQSMDHIKEMKIPPTPQQLKRGKIGRNELCPCGSGNKFKKCCLNSK